LHENVKGLVSERLWRELPWGDHDAPGQDGNASASVISAFTVRSLPLRGLSLLRRRQGARKKTSPASFLQVISHNMYVEWSESRLLNEAYMRVLGKGVEVIDPFRYRCDVGRGDNECLWRSRV
jgi:hypothetical protein